MIKITVELWPFGDESKKKTIASGKIYNDGSGSPWLGSYGYALYDEVGAVRRSGALGEYRRGDGIWKLVAAVLGSAFGDASKSFRDGRVVHRADDPPKERP